MLRVWHECQQRNQEHKLQNNGKFVSEVMAEKAEKKKHRQKEHVPNYMSERIIILMTVSQHSFSLFILFLLNLISIQVQLIIMSLKSICIIIYNGCFDHVCSWNYNAYITILCKLHFQHHLHLYIISACHQFIHSVHCFFVYSPADWQKLGGFGETLPRELLLQVRPFLMFSL